MLIYSSNSNGSFGTIKDYKSGSKRKSSSIRKNTSKRYTQQRQSSYKVKKSKRKPKILSAKNAKFLRSLGFKVRKQ